MTPLFASSMAQRSRGRYELKVPLEEPYTNNDLVANAFIMPVMKAHLKSKKIEMDTLSSVTSNPKTEGQQWHRDVFVKSDFPHGVVVFVPLLDVTEEEGPPDFLLKSHLPCSNRVLEGSCQCQILAKVLTRCCRFRLVPRMHLGQYHIYRYGPSRQRGSV
jgi:hypothetical protein